MHSIVILKKKNLTKFQSSFDVPAYQPPGRISTSQGKQYSTNTNYIYIETIRTKSFCKLIDDSSRITVPYGDLLEW